MIVEVVDGIGVVPEVIVERERDIEMTTGVMLFKLWQYLLDQYFNNIHS